MSRAEIRRAKKKERKEKTATYNFTRKSADGSLLEEVIRCPDSPIYKLYFGVLCHVGEWGIGYGRTEKRPLGVWRREIRGRNVKNV